MPEFYHEADYLLSLSRYEGFGLTMLEAWSCGKAVIASNVGIVRELRGLEESLDVCIQDDPTDVDSLSEKVQLLEARPELARRQGAIVNLVDIYAERPLKGYPAYSIAKAGLAALTRSLAVELAPDVRVNGVAPGAILWPEQADGGQTQADILTRIPLARSGSPSDIAGAVRFLLEEAPYITGQIIAVDGGRSVFI